MKSLIGFNVINLMIGGNVTKFLITPEDLWTMWSGQEVYHALKDRESLKRLILRILVIVAILKKICTR